MQSNLAPKKDYDLKITSLKEARQETREKIKSDLFRFRTCCADPRASK